ncbi:DUF3912 family protein [Bacillus cytotoxicus]|uniref:DUF3912 family protein n=1 Tax=unclassified Bacillus cereus group TaxID=2750818 RepID=UPI001F5A3303|nr:MULTISPECIES: DUF3912 family protein [unclassified Bacillus cereus group]EMA6341585.1 DUF3912 family protein [Bacillus cytotoxicus]
MNFDIVGQKAYIKDGPYRNKMGIVQKVEKQSGQTFMIVIDNHAIDIELKDIILVGIDVGQFHAWCEKNGYL